MTVLAILLGVFCNIGVSAVSSTNLQIPAFHNPQGPAFGNQRFGNPLWNSQFHAGIAAHGNHGNERMSMTNLDRADHDNERPRKYFLKSALSRLQAEAKNLQSKMNKENEFNVRLMGEKESLEEQVRTTKNANDAEVAAAQKQLETELNKTLNARQELDHAQEDEEKQLEPVKADLDKQHEESERLRTMKDKELPKIVARISILQDTKASLVKTLNSTTNELSTVASKAADLMRDRASAYNKFHPVQVSYSKQQDAILAESQHRKELNNVLEAAQAEKAALENQMSDIMTKEENVTAKLPTIENNSTVVTKELKNIQAQLLELTNERQRLLGDSKQMQRQMRKFWLDTQRLKTESSQLRAQVRHYMPQVTTLSKGIEEKQEEIKGIEQQLPMLKEHTAGDNSAVINAMEMGIKDLRHFFDVATASVAQDLDKLEQSKL